LSKHSKHEDRLLREAMLEALPRVRRFALSLTGNRHDADDLLQSTVERVLTRAVPERADLSKWMFRVCRNLWIDEIRARNVRLKATERPELAEQPLAAGEDPIIGALTLREVDRAMADLPAEQREVISLVAVEGLSYREASDVLDIPIGTIMSRLARARAVLARRFEQREAPARRDTDPPGGNVERSKDEDRPNDDEELLGASR
jgi:RNA polymerase sigma-70 factor (ECF subfamily)